MSPAPQRNLRHPLDARFPHRWGYWVGASLIVAGIALAIITIVQAITSFADDVNALRRVAGGESLLVELEEGEYFVFDEDGQRLGPFAVQVFRQSDNIEVPTRPVVDGPSYEVDGIEGEARVGFEVPSSDTYRVEVNTSLGQLASFAVGQDVGSERLNRIIWGVSAGAVLAGLGLLGLLITGISHARWQVRGRALEAVSRTREAISDTVSPAELTQLQGAAAGETVGRAKDWADAQLQRARTTVGGDHGKPPRFASGATDVATGWIDRAQASLDALGAGATDGLASSRFPAEVVQRVSASLDRVQERLEAGDNLRDIAQSEAAMLRQTSEELTALAGSGVVATSALAEGALDLEAAADQLRTGLIDAQTEVVGAVQSVAPPAPPEVPAPLAPEEPINASVPSAAPVAPTAPAASVAPAVAAMPASREVVPAVAAMPASREVAPAVAAMPASREVVQGVPVPPMPEIRPAPTMAPPPTVRSLVPPPSTEVTEASVQSAEPAEAQLDDAATSSARAETLAPQTERPTDSFRALAPPPAYD